MNLLVLCPHFAPDVAPTGEVMTSIAGELVARGHRLHLVTSLPWYQHTRIEPGWEGKAVRREDTEWGRITRVNPFPTDKRNIPARALAFAGFTALAGLAAVDPRSGRSGRRGGPGRPDAVLAMSPPLTLGAAGWLAARRWRVPFVFNIQDVFPDVAVELGAITNPAVIRAASWLERWTYRRADAVTVLSDDLRDNLVAKIEGTVADPLDRVRVIPNFVDTAAIRPADPEAGSYRREHGLVGRQVVMYAGNVGFSQSLDLVLAAARALADRPEVVFVVNGGGSARPDLERGAADLPNVRFVDFQPKERLPEVLAAADVHVVPLRRGQARAAVTKLLDGPEQARAMGAAGRAFVERWVSPAAVAERYEALFEELRARRSPGGRP